MFNQILHELREKTESHLKESITATSETLEQFRRNLTKGQNAVDLRTLTPEDIASAVLMMVPEGALPEKELMQLGDAFTDLLIASGKNHDE